MCMCMCIVSMHESMTTYLDDHAKTYLCEHFLLVASQSMLGMRCPMRMRCIPRHLPTYLEEHAARDLPHSKIRHGVKEVQQGLHEVEISPLRIQQPCGAGSARL